MPIENIENPLAVPTGAGIETTYSRQNELLDFLIKGQQRIQYELIFPSHTTVHVLLKKDSTFECNGILRKIKTNAYTLRFNKNEWDERGDVDKYILYDYTHNEFLTTTVRPNIDDYDFIRQGYYIQNPRAPHGSVRDRMYLNVIIVRFLPPGSGMEHIFAHRLERPTINDLYVWRHNGLSPLWKFWGTWEDVSSETAGEVERSEGGNSKVFGALQEDAFQDHAIAFKYYSSNLEDINPTKYFPYSVRLSYRTGYDSGIFIRAKATAGLHALQTFTNRETEGEPPTEEPRVANETRMKNRAVQKWRCTDIYGASLIQN